MATNSPLDFFNNLLFYDGIRDLMLTFPNNKELIDNGFSYVPEHNCYIKDELISEGTNAQFAFEEITRESFFIRTIIKQRQALFSLLAKPEKSDSTSEYDILKVLHRKATIKEDFYYLNIRQQLKKLIEDLRIYFPKKEHPVFNILTKLRNGASYFQYKDLKRSFFEALYETTYTLNLIDDVITTEEMFIDVFTCEKPNTSLKLIFIQANPIVAYYLKQLEVFFDNLNPITIEKSNCFYNKQGKPLNSNDLYTAKSRLTQKSTPFTQKIDTSISELKKLMAK